MWQRSALSVAGLHTRRWPHTSWLPTAVECPLLGLKHMWPADIEQRSRAIDQSHGCLRLTNWDAIRLAALVGSGARVVLR